MTENSFRYENADYEKIPCNLCLSPDLEQLARRDRNGLPVQTCICRHCGLIFINPRMTAEWYSKYYQLEYRAQMARFRGKPFQPADQELLFERARSHGLGLARRFKGMWAEGLILEVGSSTGGVLAGLRDELALPVIGIEPSQPEADEANRRSIQTHCALMENFRAEIDPPSNIVCTQSLNHLLDPRSFLAWSHARLRAGGMLALEVLNFRQLFRKYKWMPRAVQIDHPYMFLPEVLSAFVQLAGFDPVALEVEEGKSRAELLQSKARGLPQMHIALLARKADRQPFPPGAAAPNLFPEVKRSLDDISNSFPRYFLRYGLKRLLKTGRV